MKETSSWEYILYFIILLVIVLIAFIVGVVKPSHYCETDLDCKDTEFCYHNSDMYNSGRCEEKLNWFNTTKFDYNNIYCYPDNTKSQECKCKVLIYQNGTNKTLSCNCYNDLVMHYTCINITKENVTIKEVTI